MHRGSLSHLQSRAMPSRGFGMLELLVVVAIIGILAAIAIPVMGSMTNRGKDAQCLANMRQWGLALTLYLADNAGELPHEGAQQDPNWNQTRSAANERAWYNVLPPYVDQPGMRDIPNNANARRELYRRGRNILQCPRAAWTGVEHLRPGPQFSYAFNSQIFSSDTPTDRVFVVQLSANGNGNNVNNRVIGPSTVPMILDARASSAEPKTLPGMNETVGTVLAYTRRLNARHGGRANIVFFDGSVRSFTALELMDASARNIATSPVIWNPWNPDAE